MSMHGTSEAKNEEPLSYDEVLIVKVCGSSVTLVCVN